MYKSLFQVISDTTRVLRAIPLENIAYDRRDTKLALLELTRWHSMLTWQYSSVYDLHECLIERSKAPANSIIFHPTNMVIVSREEHKNITLIDKNIIYNLMGFYYGLSRVDNWLNNLPLKVKPRNYWELPRTELIKGIPNISDSFKEALLCID